MHRNHGVSYKAPLEELKSHTTLIAFYRTTRVLFAPAIN